MNGQAQNGKSWRETVLHPRPRTWANAARTLLVIAWALCGNMPASAEPPQVLLYLPLDGSPDAVVAADGYGKGCCAEIVYHAGKRGQAARIGSDHSPCSLMVPAGVNVDKLRGSLELWYQPDWEAGDAAANRPHRVLVTDGRPANESGAFALTTQGGNLGFSFWTTAHVGVGAAIGHWKKGEWHQIVVTWDGTSGMKLFLDGKPVAQCKATWTREAAAPSRYFYLGGEWNGTHRADGWFHDVRVYDQALTEELQSAVQPGHVAAAWLIRSRRSWPSAVPTSRWRSLPASSV